MLFGRDKKMETLKTLTKQQIEQAELIEELMRTQEELVGSTEEFAKEIFNIVGSQQRAIRNLQDSILRFQKLNSKGES